MWWLAALVPLTRSWRTEGASQVTVGADGQTSHAVPTQPSFRGGEAVRAPSSVVELGAEVKQKLAMMDILLKKLQPDPPVSPKDPYGSGMWNTSLLQTAGTTASKQRVPLRVNDDNLTNYESEELPNFDIYLDRDPEERLREVGKWALKLRPKHSTKGDFELFLDELGLPFGISDQPWIAEFFANRITCSNMDASCMEAKRELQGYALYSKQSTDAINAAMMLYELASGCTSIVAENEDHSIALARNLDFPGGDFLRQRLYRANWYKKQTDKEPFATSTQFAGFNLMITVNARGFAGSINQRMMTTNVQDIHNNLLRFFASEATGAVSNWWSSMRGGYPVALVLRRAAEKCPTFACAAKMLHDARIVAPVYVLLAGVAHGEGVMLQRGRAGGDDICVSLEGFHVKGMRCAVSPDRWLLSEANDDIRAERDGDAVYGRRNMARLSVLSEAEVCRSRDDGTRIGLSDPDRPQRCRAEFSVLFGALRWEFVSRDSTLHRDYMVPLDKTHITTFVEPCNPVYRIGSPENCAGPAVYFFGHLHNIEVRGCPNWPARAACYQKWERNAAELSVDYALVNHHRKPRRVWQISSLLSCPCFEWPLTAKETGEPDGVDNS